MFFFSPKDIPTHLIYINRLFPHFFLAHNLTQKDDYYPACNAEQFMPNLCQHNTYTTDWAYHLHFTPLTGLIIHTVQTLSNG